MPVSARAAADTLKVGLRYGDTALYSANLQNVNGYGWGYTLGYFDSSRDFVPLMEIADTNTISITGSGNIYVNGDGTYTPSPTSMVIGGYHIQLEDVFASYGEAAWAAKAFDGGFPAYVNGEFRVRIGHYSTPEETAGKMALYLETTWRDWNGKDRPFSAQVAKPTGTGVTVTITGTQTILFQFDGGGAKYLGVMPLGMGDVEPVTWSKGYRYYGGFEYRRSGGRLTVINVVDVDDYVKGVIPYEMSPSWPLEALKAQAVCARTYAMRETKHNSQGFDVCTSTHCQVYYGISQATTQTNRAVEETAGQCIWYDGKLIEALYSSSNGGASEDAKNVWGNDVPYLKGKEDPYEGTISIPSYQYAVTFTAGELTKILEQKGYKLGPVSSVYISAYTAVGNVGEVTFEDIYGKSVSVTGDTCRTIFNGVFSDRSVRSRRYQISGGDAATYTVNGNAAITGITGSYVLAGDNVPQQYVTSPTETYVLTADGLQFLQKEEGGSSAGVFTIYGTGYGHHAGMSQYGAKAMAEQGMTYLDILNFYFTGVTVQ